ncbi:molybdenum cofactor biosynthesis protein MoaE [Collinsella sp. An2]|uniref:molybdenum cofactor biosynthesis protein MoaE n=1 Tax=Collinsella sp. An2 TaxID=1965585 RepID=UPI000B3A015B|nr:molybdenum cofactor biosynthesis protein MoaE [Collinsella sp. An2]OUP10395.1 molybdopterin biosynthesis protein [Collinsella sp. An2]
MSQSAPSIDAWLAEAKQDPDFQQCGMYLVHNGVVRATPKARVREGVSGGVEADSSVARLTFSYDADKVKRAIDDARALPGIFYVRVWLNEGELAVGDDIMYVLVGGDIRPHVIDALQTLVGTIKNTCVNEVEHEA